MRERKIALLGLDELERVLGGAAVQGTAGRDTLRGTAEADLVQGFDGNDSLDGGGGADRLDGGSGDDTITGGAGDGAADTAYGGNGQDVFVWSPGDGSDQFHGEAGFDTLRIQGMGLDEFKGGVSLAGPPGVQVVTHGDTISFVDARGQPAQAVGSITIGGETLRFTGLEAIRFG